MSAECGDVYLPVPVAHTHMYNKWDLLAFITETISMGIYSKVQTHRKCKVCTHYSRWFTARIRTAALGWF